MPNILTSILTFLLQLLKGTPAEPGATHIPLWATRKDYRPDIGEDRAGEEGGDAMISDQQVDVSNVVCRTEALHFFGCYIFRGEIARYHLNVT